MNETIKLKVIKDYPTIDGMLYKNEVVRLDNGTDKSKLRVKDATGKIWFVDSKYLIKVQERNMKSLTKIIGIILGILGLSSKATSVKKAKIRQIDRKV